ncbi:general substrate transporter [Trichoderma compactum]
MAPYLGLSSKSLNFIIGIIGATAFALQGYDQAVGNDILTLRAFLNVFPQTDTLGTKGAQKSHNATIQGATIAIYKVGCTLGALACVYIGDKLGRIRTVFAAGVVTLVGVAIQTSAFSLGQFIAGRVYSPWGGIVTATWLEFGLFYVKDNAVNWRFPIAFQAVLALIVVSAILFMPESPRWLLKNSRTEEARKVLAVLGNTSAESETIAAEIAIISSAIQQETSSDGWNNPFAMNHGRYLHRTMLGLGINLGHSGTKSRVISGCLQIWQLLAACLAVFLVDRVGRRPLLIVSAAGMAVAHACLAGLTSNLHTKQASDAAIFFYFVALFFFPIGLFLLPFMYYIVYASISAISSAVFYLFYPETRGRTLEEIGEIFTQPKSIFETVGVAKTLPFATLPDLENEKAPHVEQSE